MRFNFTLWFVTGLILVGIFLINYNPVVNNEDFNLGKEVCFGENCYSVSVADTEAERERGLMEVDFMPKNKGMLFIFEEEGNYAFWMKDTLIPLDMIWVDSDFKIVYIEENTMPCFTQNCEVFNPNKNARYVIELNSGQVEFQNIEIGDFVEIN